MRPTWLVESSVFGTSSEPVKHALRTRGFEYDVLQTRPFLNGVTPAVNGRMLNHDDCVVFWGSPPPMRHIQLHYDWRPGGWCSFDSFDCSVYYPHLGDALLNHHCHIGSADCTDQELDLLFSTFGLDGCVFVRPCSLEKTFTGQLVDRESFVPLVWRSRIEGNPILVSSPRRIDTEWRVVMHLGEPISSSLYQTRGRLTLEQGCPKRVLTFLTHVWRTIDWYPDPLFIVDVCESEGELAILELNSFSCSGWYECDPYPIIDCAADVAVQEYTRDA